MNAAILRTKEKWDHINWVIRDRRLLFKLWLIRQLKAHWMRAVTFLLLFVFLGLGFWGMLMNYLGYVISSEEPWSFISFVLKDFGPELAGIALAVVTIDALNERRQKHQQIERLIMELNSGNPELVASALRTLRTTGGQPPFRTWLTDGTMNRAALSGVNLENVNLFGAKLKYSVFWGGNLRAADLSEADLQGADFHGTNLEGAYFHKAALRQVTFQQSHFQGQVSLRGAFLWRADLEKANFLGVDLENADLYGANLRGANLESVKLKGADLIDTNLEEARSLTDIQLRQAGRLEGAIMPDGTKLRGKNLEWIERDATSPHYTFLSHNPTLEEWLEQQKQLPPEKRVVTFVEEMDSAHLQNRPAEQTLLTKAQIERLRWQAEQTADITGLQINSIYSQLSSIFGVKSISELEKRYYRSATMFLERRAAEAQDRLT